MAKVLVRFDNVDVSGCEQRFRDTLVNETGLPFSPARYTVKRNYSRMFQSAFLGNFVGNRLVTTDICKALANDEGALKSVDDYLFTYIPKFRFPFPAFKHYNATEPRVYPFCAIVKFLLSRAELNMELKASLDDIFSYIIANDCSGFEDIPFYKALAPREYRATKNERRQLREMIVFFSQSSILKMYHDSLFLDVIDENAKRVLLSKVLTPEARVPKEDELAEFYEMASLPREPALPSFEVFTSDPADAAFIEGSRKRAEHFRVERSGLLRRYYREKNPEPRCRACGAEMRSRYPWTDYLLEIHHLLPLSSPVAVSSKGTSLADIVGLCPSCHRAVHMYYQRWLKDRRQEDFKSKQEARDVFAQAVREIAR